MKGRIISSLLALIAGALTAVASGHVASPSAAILGIFFWLRFLGHARWRSGLITFVVLHAAAWELAYMGTVPLPTLARVPMYIAFSLAYGLLYLVHIRLVRRRNRVLSSLVLPFGFVIIDFASASLSPTGSWGSLAYTFIRWLPIAQVASVAGWLAVTFVAVWIAALADLVVLRAIGKGAVLRPALLGVAVIGAVLGFGSWRLSNPAEASKQIEVLAMHGPTIHEVDGADVLAAHYLSWELADSLRTQYPALAASYQDRLFMEMAEARDGADLVVWSEALAWMSYEEEAAWIERGKAFARENATMLAMGLSVFDPSRERLYSNKLVMIDEQGHLLWDFLKARPVPGAWHIVGDGTLPAVDTRLGRIGGAICYDMDFPSLLRQAGRSDTEIFLAPSFDDKKVRWMHERMAVMRAIEQGFTLIRPTAYGLTSIADPYGRRLAQKDGFAGGGFVLRATVSVSSTRTIYSRIGDAFAWACVLGFTLIVFTGVTGKKKSAA